MCHSVVIRCELIGSALRGALGIKKAFLKEWNLYWLQGKNSTVAVIETRDESG